MMASIRFRTVALIFGSKLPSFFRVEHKIEELFSILVGVRMLATLSAEAQVNRILNDIGCAPSNFSDIAARHANSRVLQALRGTNDFDPNDAEYYLSVARQMESLAKDFPVPISWKETQKIKELLTRRSQGPPTPFAVVVVDNELFRRVTAGVVETTNNLGECAAFKKQEIAFTVAEVLRNLGQGGIRVTTITNQRRAPETFTNALVEIGFTQTGIPH